MITIYRSAFASTRIHVCTRLYEYTFVRLYCVLIKVLIFSEQTLLIS